MTLTQYLRAQHEVFLKQLDTLERLKKDAATPERIFGLRQMVCCIAEALQRHADIETKYLFPALKPHLGGRLAFQRAIEYERHEAFEVVGRLDEARTEKATLLGVTQFIVHLRDHILKEEAVIFPLAEKKLGRERLEKIARRVTTPFPEGRPVKKR